MNRTNQNYHFQVQLGPIKRNVIQEKKICNRKTFLGKRKKYQNHQTMNRFFGSYNCKF